MSNLNELMEYMRYEPHLGKFFWIKRTTNRVKIGEEVGTTQLNGYLATSFKGKRYYLHRLVWLFETGKVPNNQIDHINHNRVDNRFENLREVSHSENGKNCKKKSNNVSGITGVSFDTSRGKWIGQVFFEGKHILRKRFSSKKEAELAVTEAYKELKFHENHGK